MSDSNVFKPALYRKKPAVIQAVRITGDNIEAVADWCAENNQEVFAQLFHHPKHSSETRHITIYTLEGEMRAEPGDWIIRDVKNEFYPCKNDIFEMTYEELIFSVGK